MKKFLVYIITIGVLNYASAQWEKIHPSTNFQRSFTYALSIPATGKYYAVGKDLAISSDTGDSWKRASTFNLPVPLFPDAQYEDLHFVDEQTGVLIYNNKLFLTTDKGATWQEKISLNANPAKYAYSSYFTAVHFINKQKGIAVGTFKKLYETNDGGQTWNMISWTNQTAPYISYTDVCFVNDMVGFIGGYEVYDIVMNFGFSHFVLKTIDGGITWIRTDVPTQFDYKNISVQAPHQDTVFVCLSRTQATEETYYSINGGTTWLKNTPPLREIKVIRWLDGKTGVAFGEDHKYRNKLYRTEDAGLTWEHISLPFDPDLDEYSISDISFVDKNNGFASGSGGMLMVTNDMGKTWVMRNSFHPKFIAFDYSTSQVGYASNGKGFYKTIDGGYTWNYKEKSDSLTIASIDVDEEDNGFFYGFRNYIYYMKDEGLSIDSIAFPLIFRYDSKIISREDSLFVTGATLNPSQLTFFRSGDKGATWEPVVVENGIISAVSFHDGGNGIFYIGTSENLKRSSDGGLTWKTVYTFQNDYLSESCYLGKDTLLALMTSNKVLKSIDGGKSWTIVLRLTDPSPAKFMKVNGKYLYLYGGIKEGSFVKSAIWKSEDAGENWTLEITPSDMDMTITGMSIGGSYVYATSGYGQVIRKELPPDVIAAIHTSEKKDYVLYPVPSENTLNLRIPGNQTISEIHAISTIGQVSYLKYKNIGDIITIDISGLISGLYFLQLNTEKGDYSKSFIKE